MEGHEEFERPFDFRQCVSIIRSTGEKAADLKELREIISRVSDDSIFHHTYQYFLKQHILEYTNDFAQWAGESLEERAPEPRYALPGDEFFFNETVTFVFPIGICAKNLAEFFLAMRFVDSGCIYYHFYEARMRVPGGTDDFSRWVDETLDKRELAEKIRAIDPFMHNTEEIRAYIAGIVMEEVNKDMERSGVLS